MAMRVNAAPSKVAYVPEHSLPRSRPNPIPPVMAVAYPIFSWLVMFAYLHLFVVDGQNNKITALLQMRIPIVSV